MKKALIIGGTSGIGEGLAELLVVHQYRVGITGIEQEKIEQLQHLTHAYVFVKYLDGTKGNISLALDEFTELLCGLDLLVFSAGIGNLDKNLGHKIENKANELNVLAFTEIADWGFKYFEKQEHGHFVAITSIAGLFGCWKAPAYHAAKAYQIKYLESLRQKALKAKMPICITDVRPGFVKTPMTIGKKMVWAATTEKAAKQIFALIKKKKCHGYVTKRWRIVVLIIKMLPTWVRIRL